MVSSGFVSKPRVTVSHLNPLVPIKGKTTVGQGQKHTGVHSTKSTPRLPKVLVVETHHSVPPKSPRANKGKTAVGAGQRRAHKQCPPGLRQGAQVQSSPTGPPPDWAGVPGRGEPTNNLPQGSDKAPRFNLPP